MIDYSEFVAATINRQNVLSVERLTTVFKTIDQVSIYASKQDGNGVITVDELKSIFGNGKLPDEIWKQIMEEVDNNGDGELSFAEFQEMMLKLTI